MDAFYDMHLLSDNDMFDRLFVQFVIPVDRGMLELRKTSDFGKSFRTIGTKIYSFGLGGKFIFASVMTGSVRAGASSADSLFNLKATLHRSIQFLMKYTRELQRLTEQPSCVKDHDL